jgi:uncharacterized membrane protein YgaE (UPF0421/DUF939 family)
MRIAWQSLVPVGIALVAAIAVLVALNLHHNWLMGLGVNVLILIVVLWRVARTRQPVTGRQDDLPDVEVRPT